MGSRTSLHTIGWMLRGRFVPHAVTFALTSVRDKTTVAFAFTFINPITQRNICAQVLLCRGH